MAVVRTPPDLGFQLPGHSGQAMLLIHGRQPSRISPTGRRCWRMKR